MKSNLVLLTLCLTVFFHSPVVYSQDPNQRLITAVKNDSLDEVRASLQAGANLETKDSNGNTPFMLSLGKDPAIAEYLLSRGANVNAVNKFGGTTLMIASQFGQTQMVKILLAKKVPVSARFANDGTTALWNASFEGRTEIVKLLLDADANPSDKNSEDGFTALMVAAQNNHASTCRLLVDRGADVNATANKGWTALMGAAGRGYHDIVELLVERGADVNAERADNKWTPLLYAVRYNHVGVADYLLRHGARPDAKTDDGQNVQTLAKKYGDSSMIALVEGKRTGITSQAGPPLAQQPALLSAAELDDTRTLTLLLKTVSPNLQDKVGRTALMLAVSKGHLAAVRLLLSKGADPNLKTKNSGQTALMYVSESNAREIIRALLEKGADVNAKSLRNATPLIAAIQRGNHEAIEMLINAGAVYTPGAPSLGETPAVTVEVTGAVMNDLIYKWGVEVAFFTSRINPIHRFADISDAQREVGVWDSALVNEMGTLLSTAGVKWQSIRLIGNAYFTRLFITNWDLRLFAVRVNPVDMVRPIVQTGGGILLQFVQEAGTAQGSEGKEFQHKVAQPRNQSSESWKNARSGENTASDTPHVTAPERRSSAERSE